MIWESIVLMTIIDLLIILVSLASLWMLFIQRSKLIKSGFIFGSSVVVAGLIAVGLFYAIDLFTMFVLPLLTTRAAATTAMENLHLNYSWIVILVGTFSIFTGFAFTSRRLFLNIDNLEKKTLELERAVTERKRGEEVLRESEERFRTIFEMAGAGIAVATPDGRFLHANPFLCRLLCYSENEMRELTVSDVTHPDDFEQSQLAVVETKHKPNHSINLEKRYVRKDGSIVWAQTTAAWIFDANKKPIYRVGVIQDITERKRAEKELREQTTQLNLANQQLSALYSVTATASRTLELDQVLQEVIKKITEIFHFDATRIFLFNPEIDELHLRASFETRPEFFAHVRTFRRGQGNVGRVAETGEPLIFEDVQSNPQYQKFTQTKNTQNAGFSFFAVFPIKSKLRTVGTLTCIGRMPRHLTPSEIELITSMSNQIGVAVENANLFEETIARAKELSDLYSVATVVNQSLDLKSLLRSVMDKVLEIFDFDASSIYLFDNGRGELRLLAHDGFPKDIIPPSSLKSGQGITGRVFEAGDPLLFEDIRNDPEFGRLSLTKASLRAGFRGHFSIPVGVKRKTVGVIHFLSKEVHRFSPSETQLIRSIADHLGTALENAQLYDQTKMQTVQLEKDIVERKEAQEQIQRQMQRLDILSEINRAINSTLDLRPVLDLLLEKIDFLLPYSATTIRLLNRENGELERTACRNIDEEKWKRRKPVAGPFAKAVMESKRPMVRNNIQTDSRSLGTSFFRDFGLVSNLGVPLIVKSDALGVLSFYTKREHRFANEELEFLTTLAGQAAIAIHNSQLHEQVKKRTQELSALYSITAATSKTLELDEVLQEVIKRITETFHFDATRIFLFNPQMDELHLRAAFEPHPEFVSQVRAFRLGQGIVGKAVEIGGPLIFEDIQTDPRYDELGYKKLSKKKGLAFFAVFPIKSKIRTPGAIVCAGKLPRRLATDEVELITSMADQIAVAVENAQLYEQTKMQAVQLQQDIAERKLAESQLKQANADLEKSHEELKKRTHELRRFTERLEILHEIDQAILAVRSPEEIAQAAVRHLRQLVPCLRASVVGFDVDTDKTTVLAVNVSGETRIGAGVSFPLKDIPAVETMRQGKANVVEDIPTPSEKTKVVQALYAEGMRCYINIPLISQGELIGCLNLASDRPRAFSQGHIEVAKEVTDSVAVAIQNARLFDQVHAGRQQMQLLSHRLVEAQEVERHAIARELHDEIGQVLTGLKLTLEASMRLPADKYQDRLGEAQELINEIMTRVRELSLDLRPPMLDDLGLLPALQWLFERYTAQTTVKVSFKHAGIEGQRFLPEVETATYRVLQEALTNVARHAGVSEATVQIWADKSILNLQVEDQGTGFNPKATLDAGRASGLAGMRERAISLDGQLTIQSAPDGGSGTRLTVALPLGQGKAN